MSQTQSDHETYHITTEDELRDLVRFREHEKGVVLDEKLEELMFGQIWRQCIDGHIDIPISMQEYRRFVRFRAKYRREAE